MTFSVTLPDAPGSRALAIVEAIAEALDSGALQPGERLPTHRHLARDLGVSIGTVSRAYAEAERRGLIIGEVGRGTFARPTGPAAFGPTLDATGWAPEIDLGMNFPVRALDLEREIYSGLLAELAAGPDPQDLLDVSFGPRRARRHREAGARWVGRAGLDVAPERVVLGGGFHASLVALFTHLSRPGDLVLTEGLSYLGLGTVLDRAGLRLRGLAMDREGILPKALEAACREGSPRFLHLQPTIHSITCARTSPARREAIAEIAARHDLLVIEDDDAFALLPEPLPTVASLIPERTILLADPSRCLSVGLQCTYLLPPPELAPAVERAVAQVAWADTELLREITTRLVLGPDGERLIAAKREELAARHDLAREILVGLDYAAQPQSHHLWLTLPPPWRSDALAAAAAERGLGIPPTDVFVVGPGTAPAAARICLGATRDRLTLERGLRELVGILTPRSRGEHVLF